MDRKCNGCSGSYGLKVCLTCHQKLCSTCQRLHVKEKNHTFQFPDFEQRPQSCKQHTGRFLTSYCSSCSLLICDDCFDLKHNVHKVDSLLVAKSNAVKKIQADKKLILDKLAAVETNKKKIEEHKQRISDSITNVRSEINQMTAVKGVIYNIKSEVLNELWDLKAGKNQKLDIARDHTLLNETEIVLLEIQSVITRLENNFQQSFGTDTTLVDRWLQYETMMCSLVKVPDDKQPVLQNIDVVHVKPSDAEIKNLLFRIEIRDLDVGKHSAIKGEDSVGVVKLPSSEINLYPKTPSSPVHNEVHVKALKEAAMAMHNNVSSLRLCCEKGSQQISFQKISFDFDQKEMKEMVADQQKQILEILDLFKSQNAKLLETEERLERARDTIRQKDKNRQSELCLDATVEKIVDNNELETITLQKSLEKSQQNHDAACKELEESRKETQMWKTQANEYLKRVNDTEKSLKVQRQAAESNDEKKTEFEQRLKALEQQLIDRNKELDKERRNNRSLQSSVGEISQLRQQFESTKTAKEDCEIRLKSMQKQTDQLKSELAKNKREIEDLKNRLSQIAGAKLMSGNASIADLGDRFRPTRIAEMFSELYDNEWTDAVGNLTTKERHEDMVVQYLFLTLQACYESCSQLASEQMKSLERILFYQIPDDMIKSKMQLHITEKKQLIDVRKGIAIDVATESLKDVSRADSFISVFRRYNSIDENLVRDIIHQSYFAKCTTVCWLMVVQDPPMVFDSAMVQGTKLDKDIYRPFTQSGSKILYSVWPAMFLQRDGPLLVKGVAQCSN